MCSGFSCSFHEIHVRPRSFGHGKDVHFSSHDRGQKLRCDEQLKKNGQPKQDRQILVIAFSNAGVNNTAEDCHGHFPERNAIRGYSSHIDEGVGRNAAMRASGHALGPDLQHIPPSKFRPVWAALPSELGPIVASNMILSDHNLNNNLCRLLSVQFDPVTRST